MGPASLPATLQFRVDSKSIWDKFVLCLFGFRWKTVENAVEPCLAELASGHVGSLAASELTTQPQSDASDNLPFFKS